MNGVLRLAGSAFAALMFAIPAWTQEITIDNLDDLFPFDEESPYEELFPEVEPEVVRVATAEAGVLLRALDKVSGEVVDFPLTNNQTKQLGRIQVTLEECRYPVENPAGDAFAWLVIRNAADGVVGFSGWMVASSPALKAFDHPRYDVWVLRCITPDAS